MNQLEWKKIRRASLGVANPTISTQSHSSALIDVLRLFPSQGSLPPCQKQCIAETIDKDPRFRSEFFRQLNFEVLPLSRPIRSSRDAIEFLGMENSRLLLISSGIQCEKMLAKSTLIHARNFWAANQERALIALEIAKIIGADELMSFVAARIQDFCLPQLFSRFEKNYVNFLTSSDPLYAFESACFGWNHASLAACALLDWKCPDELVCTVLMHHSGLKALNDEKLKKTPVAAVAISSLFPDPLKQVPDGLKQLQVLTRVAPEFDWEEIAANVDRRFQQTERRALNHISLRRRLQRLQSTQNNCHVASATHSS